MSEVDGVLEANYNKFAVTPEHYWGDQYTYYRINENGELEKCIKVDFCYSYKYEKNGEWRDTTIVSKSVMIAEGATIANTDIPKIDKAALNVNPNSLTGDFLGWYEVYHKDYEYGDAERLIEFDATQELEESKTVVAVWNETIEVSENGSVKSIADAINLMDHYCAYTIKVNGTLTSPQSIIAPNNNNDWYNYKDQRFLSITIESGGNTKQEINPGWTENNGEWTNNKSDAPEAPVLTIDAVEPIIIKNLKITGGYAVNGGGIFADNYESNVTIAEGAEITGNGARAGSYVGDNLNLGGGVYTKGTLTMTGGNISNNIAFLGGGVSLYGGTFIMTGGVIDDNIGQRFGGGVYINPGSQMYMSGTAVVGDASAKTTATAVSHSNIADDGGGVYLEPSTSGCGLYLGYEPYDGDKKAAPFTGGIYYNYAYERGGAINAQNGHPQSSEYSKVEMASGNIAGNAAKLDGGGIYLESETGNNNVSARFTMSGGNIDSNNAEEGNGKGVYVGYTSSNIFAIFNISDSAKVAADNDVYLPSGNSITVLAPLSADTVAVVTPQNYGMEPDVQIITAPEGESSTTTIKECGRFFVTPQTGGPASMLRTTPLIRMLSLKSLISKLVMWKWVASKCSLPLMFTM